MKITVEASVSRGTFGRVVDHSRDTVLSASAADRLTRELEDELRAVSASERAADPEMRRDALERAVRRIWGAAL